MTTTAEHLAARRDIDLRERLVAAAELAGVPGDANAWVDANIGALITAPVDGNSTIASVHAYANGNYQDAIEALPERPGADLAAVTDTHLAAAVAAVKG